MCGVGGVCVEYREYVWITESMCGVAGMRGALTKWYNAWWWC